MLCLKIANKQCRADETPQNVASHQGLHCLWVNHELVDSRLWVRVDPHLGLHCLLRPVRSNAYRKVQYMVKVVHRQTGKIVTKSSVITNRLLIAMAGLIIDYLFSSDKPALKITVRCIYHKFSDRWAWANRVDPDQMLQMQHLIWVCPVCHSFSSF